MVDGQIIREQGFGLRVGNKPKAEKAKDRRWVSISGDGERLAASALGCRCWSTPWRRFRAPNCVPYPATVAC